MPDYKIAIPNPGKTTLTRGLYSVVQPILNGILGLRGINHHYDNAVAWGDAESFGARILRSMKVDLDVSAEEIKAIPNDKPLVIISNHPFGGMEALVLDAVFEHIRPDMKYIANFILNSIPEYRERIFAVDPFGGKEAAKRNFAGVRNAIKWVKSGHALTVFPAGEVSHVHLKHRKIMDGPWNTMAARIIQSSDCYCVPVFFYGFNSRIFQVMGLIHPKLRTIMLSRELLKKENQTIALRIGSPIPAEKCSSFESPEQLTDYLRMRTYILQNLETKVKKLYFPRFNRKKLKKQKEIIPPVDKTLLVDEITRLHADHCLIDKMPLSVYYFRSEQCPSMLREIGRLREVTFREVGEGSGKELDLDSYDEYYLHLIVWDRKENELVGAYRAGQSDLILDRFGKKGLYTSTLFHFKKRLLKEIYPVLELGRSFVQPKYQKQFSSLLLLWKGIGHFVALNPKYRYLMGPVSISRDYSDQSRVFLKHFLQENYSAPELSKKVKPVKPLKLKVPKAWETSTTSMVVQHIADVDELINEMENELQGIPVLLRQYLKLEAKLLGFNIDPDFGYVLDALLLIDLTQVPKRILKRYMSADGAEAFLKEQEETAEVRG